MAGCLPNGKLQLIQLYLVSLFQQSVRLKGNWRTNGRSTVILAGIAQEGHFLFCRHQLDFRIVLLEPWHCAEMIVMTMGQQNYFRGQVVLFYRLDNIFRFHTGVNDGTVAFLTGHQVAIRCKAMHRHTDHFHLFFTPFIDPPGRYAFLLYPVSASPVRHL